VELNVAVAHGLANAKILMDKIKAGEANYHFIEIMACPSGCIGGGGQPIPTNMDIRKRRAAGIYEEDEKMVLRKSHENPEVALRFTNRSCINHWDIVHTTCCIPITIRANGINVFYSGKKSGYNP
jgi:iron only hydrogenase large subunit-like protein